MNLQENTKVIFKEIFQGKKYSFQAEIVFNSTNYFTIYAKHLKTGAVSPITNLNFIIGALGQILVNENNISETDWESTWNIEDRKLAESIWDEITISFKNPEFVCYLENQLDADRNCGGWNSAYNF